MKKRNYLLIIFSLFLFACAQADIVNVSIKDYDAIIDVRTKKEFDAGHLENAINIPYTEIREEIQKHVKDKKTNILLYCRSGRRSGIALRILHEMGYVNAVNAGTYKKLKEQELRSKQKESKEEM